LNHVETPSEFQGVHSFSYLHAAPKVTLDDVGVLVQFNDVAARGLNAGGQTGDDPHPVRDRTVRMSPFDQSSLP